LTSHIIYKTSREDFNSRRFVIASGREELIEKLNAPASSSESKQLQESLTEIVFMFPDKDLNPSIWGEIYTSMNPYLKKRWMIVLQYYGHT